jgi:hypothetical protein
MLTYSSFNTFEDVVKHYENTKPINERKHGTSRNVRPIGDRARKWENIQKISRNCYAITSGHERGNDLFPYWSYNTTTIDANNNYVTTYDNHGAKLEDYAPIVWRKRKDGTVTITINNITGIHYSFLKTQKVFVSIRKPTPSITSVGGLSSIIVSTANFSLIHCGVSFISI